MRAGSTPKQPFFDLRKPFGKLRYRGCGNLIDTLGPGRAWLVKNAAAKKLGASNYSPVITN